MFSPSTPVKFIEPVSPRRMAFGEWRCGGMISTRVVHPVGDIERRGGGALRRQARVDEDQRAALRSLGLDELRRARSRGSICRLYFQMKGSGLAALHDLAVLVVCDAAVHHPVGRHVVGVHVAVQFIQRCLEVRRSAIFSLRPSRTFSEPSSQVVHSVRQTQSDVKPTVPSTGDASLEKLQDAGAVCALRRSTSHSEST